MPLPRCILLLLAMLPRLAAQETAFQFQVLDTTRTDQVDATAVYGVEITTFDDRGPRFHFHQNTGIEGLKLDHLTCTTEQFSGDLPVKDWEEFQKAARQLPLAALQAHPQPNSQGTLVLDGKTVTFSAGPDDPERGKWKKLLDALVRSHPPDWTLGKTTRTVQGEKAPLLDITIPEILKDPAKYDGKRLRITGFHHNEEECSHFVPTAAQASDFHAGIWFGGTSSFLKEEESIVPNDCMVKVEGTFSTQPGARGHMGLWAGSMTLVTSLKPLSAPAKAPDPGH